jgi:hypothetical protein
MIHNIELSINLEVMGLSHEQLFEITDKLAVNNEKISFEELNKIFMISDRPYHIRSIDLPEFNKDNEFSIKITKIEVVG